jgi:haloalkane dehalogenase
MTSEPSVLRTPDECFAALPGYGFAPHYVPIEAAGRTLRMHYLDEGAAGPVTALLLHGEPTWSYLYRNVIPSVTSAGFRCIAPDWIGFGRSDKWTQPSAYSYEAHVDSLRQLLDRLELDRVVLVCQDWGGPIGLRVLAERPERFAAVLATNTVLPNGEPPPRGVAPWPGPAIQQWIDFCWAADDLAVDEIVASVCVTRPSAEALAGYRAPFPDPRYKAGTLAFTRLIPTREDMPGYAENRAAWAVLERYESPFLTAFSDSDPTTRPWAEVFQQRVPGARGLRHPTIAGAGHFVQEERGPELAAILIDLLRDVA